MGQRAALLSLSPGMGPVHSRVRTSSCKTAAFQHALYCSVWDGSACTDSFYRKHFQAHVWMFSSLRGKALKWPKLRFTIVGTYVKLPLLPIILFRLSRPRLWGGWWVWYLSPLPVQGIAALHSYQYAAVGNRVLHTPGNWPRGPLDLSKKPS